MDIVTFILSFILLAFSLYLLYDSIKLSFFDKQKALVKIWKLASTTKKIAYDLFNETNFKEKTHYWNEPSLDTTNYANDIKQEIILIDSLKKIPSFENKEEFKTYSKNVNIKILSPITTESILKEFYDNELKIFKQHYLAPFEITSIGDALRTIYEHTDYPTTKDLYQLKEKYLGNNFIFMDRCYDGKSGFFKKDPFDNELTISTTFAAFLTIDTFFREDPDDLKKKWKTIPFKNIRNTISTLKDEYKYAPKNEDIIGFSEKKNQKPFVCSTFYGIRIALCSCKISEHVHDDDNQIKFSKIVSKEDAEGILRFLDKTYSKKEGGFAVKQNAKCNIVHTRYALQIIKHLMLEDVITEKQVRDFIKPKINSILAFVNNCRRSGGYLFYPEDDHMPTLSATRYALKITRYLEELYKYKKIFEREKFLEMVSDIFWKNCFEKRINLSYENIPDVKRYLERCKKENLYLGLEN